MRSQREHRQEKKLRYASARQRAEKHQQAGFSATYLKLPDGVKLFKPKIGVMLLDILPFRAGEGNPSAEAGLLHYERTYFLHPRVSMDGQPYLCPRLTSKSRCPICDHRGKLLKEADPENEDIVKDMAPRERQLFNVIDLRQPDRGIQIWDMSYHLFGKLLDARIRNSDEDEGWDQFSALEGGMSLKVAFKESSFGGRTFVEAETIDFRRRTKDYDPSILDEVHCLDELLIEPDFDELKEAFLGGAASPKKKIEDEEDEEEEEPEEEEAPVSRKRKPAPAEEEEEEPEEEEEEEEAPTRKKKAAAKDDEDDEDEDFDGFEEKASKKSRKAKDDEEEDDEEPEEEEEEEEAPTRKKKAKDDEDEDEEEEEEDEEERPRVKTRDEEEDEEETPKPARRRR